MAVSVLLIGITKVDPGKQEWQSYEQEGILRCRLLEYHTYTCGIAYTAQGICHWLCRVATTREIQTVARI